MIAASIRRGYREQAGVTVVEGIIAAFLVVLGAVGVLAVFDASARNTYRAEESQVVINRLQAELEELRSTPYAELAMVANPGSTSDHHDPRWRVSGSSYAVVPNGTDLEPMVLNGGVLEGGGTIEGGTVSPGPEPFTVGDVSGRIFRFIVWEDDPACGTYCPGEQDVKRVIVAAAIDQAPVSFERNFQEVQSDVVDPEATPVDNPAPPEQDTEDAFTAQLWLTDTACSESTRQPLTGDHPAHNTLGTCGTGSQTGATAGAPDLLHKSAPPNDPAYPANAQPVYDLATDVEPTTGGELDQGVLLRAPSQDGCVLEGSVLGLPAGESDPHHKVHKWLSPPVPTGGSLVLRSTATLALWTRTLNGASHPGAICAYLFVHETNVGGDEVDTRLINAADPQQDAYFEYSDPSWPTEWTRIFLEMQIGEVTLDPGDRIGVAITTERAGTAPAEALEFMYDHPNFDTRVELQTGNALPF